MRRTSTTVAPRLVPALAARLAVVGLVAIAVALAACATPPKPRELSAYDQLRKDPMAAEAARRAPDLVGSATRLGEKAHEEWQSDDLPESRRDALLAYIKLKTAIATAEQQQARVQVSQLDGELKSAQDEYSIAVRELKAAEDTLVLLRKLVQSRGEVDRERKQADERAADEKRRLERLNGEQQRKAATDRLEAAERALKAADGVEAATHAAPEHSAAKEAVARARDELQHGNWSAAVTAAEEAVRKAEHATELARPLYQKATQARANQEREERMAREAESIPGVAVRRDRRGEAQRLILSVQDLFAVSKSKLQPAREGVLDGIAALLSKYPSYPVQIIGHTDAKGNPAKLTALSVARANVVQQRLVARGVQPTRLVTSGMGAEEPIADNRTATGRARNNRIEIVLLYH